MENTGEVQQVTPAQESTAIVPTGRSGDRNEIKSLFAEWLALPDELRSPKTQKAFGAKYGIHQNTLSEWKFTPEIQEQVSILVRRHAALRFPQFMEYLEQAAKAGDVRAMELYFKLIHNYRERLDLSANVENRREVIVRFGDEDAVPFFSQKQTPTLEAKVN